MLNMAQIHYIKDLYENEDLSLREIARRTQHSFSTVQKYAYQEDWSEDTLPIFRTSMSGWKQTVRFPGNSGTLPGGYMTGCVQRKAIRAAIPA